MPERSPSPAIKSSVIVGEPGSPVVWPSWLMALALGAVVPSPSLSIRSTALPGVSRKNAIAAPTSTPSKAGSLDRPSASVKKAVSSKRSKNGWSSDVSPSPPTKSASHSVTPTLSRSFELSFLTLCRMNTTSSMSTWLQASTRVSTMSPSPRRSRSVSSG